MTDLEEQLTTFAAIDAEVTHVVDASSAALLLVDLGTREVVYANELAEQLAPGLALPLDIEKWSRAAGLLTPAGDELTESLTPLHRVAQGLPVNGEAMTAARRSDVTAAREQLWVIGMPMSDAPEPLGHRALVVFLPLRDRKAVTHAQQAGHRLRHRAVIASDVSFSISDPHTDDDPLVWVNPAFERVTGYRAADVLGRNCRFLQGPATDRAAIARIRAGLRTGKTVTETVLNYRADGTAFWNHVVISPIFDAEGVLTHHVGVQSDVTLRVEAERERQEALEEARRANDRLTALAAINQQLAAKIGDGGDVLTALPDVVAGQFGGWVAVCGLDADRRISAIAVAHGDDGMDARIREVTQAAIDWAEANPGRVRELTTTLATDTPVVLRFRADEIRIPTARRLVDALDTGGAGELSVALTPLSARGQMLGLLMLVTDHPAGYQPEALSAIADLGLRSGLAIDNARLYAREHDAAIMLPRIPEVDGFDIAASYRPAASRAEVGGDWYDVIELPSGGVGVAVGDVMGHDLRAASIMGQMRSVLRAYAWAGAEPSRALEQLDDLVRGTDIGVLATCTYGVIRHDPEAGECRITYSRAGHPPALLKHPDGAVQVLDGVLTGPIGVPFDHRDVRQATAELEPGSALVLFTDGLIERRNEDIDEGLERLEASVETAPADADAQTLCDWILDTMPAADHEDDTCILVVRRML